VTAPAPVSPERRAEIRDGLGRDEQRIVEALLVTLDNAELKGLTVVVLDELERRGLYPATFPAGAA
jgi:hypothetical protein